MEQIKPEAKNDTLTTGCPATKALTIALVAATPALVQGKQSVFRRSFMDSSCIRGLYGATMALLYNHADFRIRAKLSSLEGKVQEYLSV
ncbi:uncharacterized [Tachysurus ichikawai]